MNKLIDNIDQITLITGVLLTFYCSYRVWKRSGKNTRLALLPLFFWAPVQIIVCMFSHLFEVTYHCIETNFTGHFAYGFFLYSLYLLPLVLIAIAYRYLRHSINYCIKRNHKRQPLFKEAGLICLITIPAIKISPIAALPAIVCIFSLSALFFVRKKIRSTDSISKIDKEVVEVV